MSEAEAKKTSVTLVVTAGAAIFTVFIGLIGILSAFRVEIVQQSPLIIYAGMSILLSLAAGICAVLYHQLRHVQVKSASHASQDAAELSPVETLHRTRLNLNYQQLVEQGEREIVAVGLSLPSFATEQMLILLGEKVHKGLIVRLLLANPYVPSVTERPRSLYPSGSQYHPQKKAVDVLSEMYKYKADRLAGSDAERFQIRVTHRYLPIGLVAIDNRLIWSPYLVNVTGANAPYVDSDLQQSKVAPLVMDHFDKLWSEATPVDREPTPTWLKNLVALKPTPEIPL